MTNGSESDAVPDDPSTSIEPPTPPKRGAFPTPKSEIEKAKPYIPKPYIPDIGDVDDSPERKPDPPTDVEGEQEG
jgi:hypothetical protein